MPGFNKGFTLVELMIGITIIAILSTVGYVVFSNIQKNARDAKRKEDVNAIAKAYEANYSNQYNQLASSNFAIGSIPNDPRNVDYYNVLATDYSAYKVCAALENNSENICNSSTSSCYCKGSAQGSFNQNSQITGFGSELGLGNDYCDPDNILDQGLVGYWNLNKGSGTSANDSSGSNNHGTLINGSIWSTDIPSPQFGKSISFNGSTNYIAVPNSVSLSLNSSLTLSAWVKRNSLTSFSYTIISKGSLNGGSTNVSYGLFLAGTNNYSGRISNNGSTITGITSSGVYNDTNWHLVTLVYNSSLQTLNLYIDGVQAATPLTGVTSSLFTNNTNFTVGSMILSGAPSWFWNGLIDDVRVYNRPLSAVEIGMLYNSGVGCVP
jgi:prepilin-type N-terminal cleavage/methylation domain-containing protein